MPNTPGEPRLKGQEPHLNSQDSQLGDGDYPEVLSRTIVDRAANPKGTIVAFHGVSDNGASLADIGARWGEQWRVVLVDSLGHGLSPRFSPQQLQAPFRSALQAAAETVRVEAGGAFWAFYGWGDSGRRGQGPPPAGAGSGARRPRPAHPHPGGNLQKQCGGVGGRP